MMDAKIAFAHFASGARREAHLFAELEHPFEIGEPTSDLLSYFGFSSGQHTRVGAPAWLNEYVAFRLPSIESYRLTSDESEAGLRSRVLADYMYHCLNILHWYYERGVVLQLADISRFFYQLSSMLSVEFPSAQSNFLDAYSSRIDPRRSFSAGHAITVFGVDFDGTPYHAFGGPRISANETLATCDAAASEFAVLSKKLRCVFPGDGIDYDWRLSTGVGVADHAVSLISSLRRHQFVRSAEQQEQMLGNLSDSVCKFFRVPSVLSVEP